MLLRPQGHKLSHFGMFLLFAVSFCCAQLAQAGRETISFVHIGTEQGLPQSTVNTTFQDSQGFIWIGTYDGLTRYDGYRFTNFKNDPQDPESISNNIVVSIIEDNAGFLWAGTAQNGVNRFDPTTGKFTRFESTPDDFDSLSNPQVRVVHQDTEGRVWVGTNDGLNLFLPEKQAFAHFTNNPLDDQSLPDGPIIDIVDDGTGNLWVASNEMLAHFNIEQQVFSRLDYQNNPTQINDLYLDTDNSLWIGTLFDGLYHLQPDTLALTQYQHDKTDPGSLSSNDVRAVLRVRSGDLWVGTQEGGLSVRPKGSKAFNHFKRNSADSHSLAISDVWSIFQDSSGLIWVGTAGGGLNMTMSFENRFSRLTYAPLQKNGLSHEFVWDIEEDNHGNLWFATLNGIDQYNPQQDSFKYYNQFATAEGDEVGGRIHSLAFDQYERIWFGNQQGQLAVFDPKTGSTKLIQRDAFRRGYVSTHRIRMIERDRFNNMWIGTDDGLLKVNSDTLKIIRDYNFVNGSVLADTLVRTMLQDENGIIWFGTWNKGLLRYDPEFDTIDSFENNPRDQNSISDNTIRSLFKDNLGNLWVGTFNGLNLLSSGQLANKDYQFKRFLEKDGLPNSVIYSIVAATDGNLWLSTNKGLSEFNPQTENFSNFTTADGLTTNEFNGNAAVRTLNDDIYFGSVNGVTIISAISHSQSNFQPQIRFTQIHVQGTPYFAKGVILDEKEIQLSHNKNDLSIEFAALDFRHPQRNRFQYRLLPYREQWTDANSNNLAVFTNLDPNQYTLQLKATNSDGQWIDSIKEFKFSIEPPLWQTWWAYLSYFGGAMAIVLLLLNRQEKSLQEQKAINEHLRRVDQIKDEFLANTSHELRTPLNGIIGIAESLKEGIAGPQNPKTLSHLQLVIDGGKRLSQLVNDILDFKKLSHQNLVLQRKAVDLSSIVNVVLNLLTPLAKEKKLKLINAIPENIPLLYADENRIQQVLHNLVGNAIKYSDSGEITLLASSENNFVQVCVQDTGFGIDENQLELIFKPFEQATLSQSVPQRGTGLGLPLSRQLIEEHGGHLWAESEKDKGSKFFFDIPVWLDSVHEADVTESITNIETKNRRVKKLKLRDKPEVVPTELETVKNKSVDKGCVLIADDDPINLQVLADLLQMQGYSVEQAKDGLQAVELAKTHSFQLAIIDIMMPGLTGYEVCKKLRKKFSAIELPILLLSARNQPGDIQAGFEAGANDYVTKPIERDILLSRIHTMSLLRGLVKAKQQQEHATTLQQACERLGKYFPEQMVKQIVTNDASELLVAQRKKITVLFADLAGFTSISDRFEPESITDILNSFLGKMGKLVEKHGGILNEILGDGLVILFGALDNMDKQQQAAASANLALDMQQAMTELSAQWLDAGIDHNVRLRVGIHQDFATVGNFGSEDIVAFRAVGSGVNLAARLENYSPDGKITVSYPIFAQTREMFDFTELEEVQFKGFTHPHRVCQLVSKKLND